MPLNEDLDGFQEVASTGKPFYEDDADATGTKGGNEEEYVTVEEVDGHFLPPFIEDIYTFAKECVEDFFADKDSFQGGPFTENDLDRLYSEESISTVVNTTVSAAVMTAYAGIERASWINSEPPQDGIPADDVRLMISILNACSKRGVPKYFAGGIALLCLDFCEGVKVPYDRIEEFHMLEEGWVIEYEDDGYTDEFGEYASEYEQTAEDDDDFNVNDYVIDDGLPR